MQATTATVHGFYASDGYPLRYRHWIPERSAPKGYVVALHGIQSHAGWYDYSSQRLSDAGYDVRFVDRRGSGMNQRDRGHAEHADRLVNDLVQFLVAVRHERDRTAPQAPVIVSAVSWGGKLAAILAARRPELVDGLVLLSPGLKPYVRPNGLQRCLLSLAMATGKGRRMVKIPLNDPELFTAEKRWQTFIRDDPLALHSATVSLLAASVRLDTELRFVPHRIVCPVLLLLAGADRIIDNDATRSFFEQWTAPEKTLRCYHGAAHTLEFEPNRDAVFTDLIDWLNSRSGREAPEIGHQ